MNEERRAAVAFLVDKARQVRGMETLNDKQRKHAVDALLGRKQRKPLRPGVRQLLGKE